MDILYGLCLGIVATISLVGILSPRYKDNLLQCIGLTEICMASTIRLWAMIFNGNQLNAAESLWLMMIGVATFAVGMAVKVVHFDRQEKQRQLRERIAKQ